MTTTLARLRSWLRSTTQRQTLESNMEEEIRFHLEARAADLVRDGMTGQEALRRARIEFGGVATHKHDMRNSLGLRWWDDLRSDLRYAAHILKKSPGFTLIAVCSLGLAIGANTSIFFVANQMLYERLGVPHPEQLQLLTLTGDDKSVVHMSWGNSDTLPNGKSWWNSLTYPIYQQLRAQNNVLQDLFAFKGLGRANATIDGVAQSVDVQLVSGNFYQQMHVQPMLGRAILTADDGAPGTGAVAVISYGLWSRVFGRSPSVIGKVVTINMTPVTIVGVNPKSFTGAESVQGAPEFFIPLSMMPLLRAPLGDSGPALSSDTLYWLQVMGRTKPGVSLPQASSALDVLLSAAVRATTTIEKDETLPHILLMDGSKGLNFSALEYADPLHVLLAMVGAVLLMACANMANLMLARASARQREMSVRLALGASRGRILRQVLTESLFLSFLGGTLGLVLGYFGRTALPKLLADSWAVGEVNVPFNWKVFVFAAAITIGTGILFGIFPAWAATRAEIGAALKQAANTATRRRKAWSGKAIVAFQVALSTLLVAAAALFLRTLIHLNAIDPGFQPANLILFEIEAPSKRYPSPKDVALHGRIEEVLRSVPGVEGVTASMLPFLAGANATNGFHVEGKPEPKYVPGDNTYFPDMSNVGTDFNSVMKIPIIAGRSFGRQDTESSAKVAIINRALAQKFFPNQNPLGKRFSTGKPDKDTKWIRIVGISSDFRYAYLRKDPPPLFLLPYRQQAEANTLTYIVRTSIKPEAIVPSLRAAVHGVDSDLPLTDVRTQVQQIHSNLQQERMFASLTSGFGVLAIMLACVGLYGIMAYTVVQRTNEIGIRLALGAKRRQVRLMVLSEVGWLTAVGVVTGITITLAASRAVQSMLYGVRPADPWSLVGAASLLLLVAVVSGWVPAMRASRVEPMEALRHE
jgi:predicted permease